MTLGYPLGGVGHVTSVWTADDRVLPNALQVADPLHAIRLANHRLDEVRRRVQNETLGHRGRKGDPLYRTRRLLTEWPIGACTAGGLSHRGPWGASFTKPVLSSSGTPSPREMLPCASGLWGGPSACVKGCQRMSGVPRPPGGTPTPPSLATGRPWFRSLRESASVANNALMNDAIEIKSALIPTRRGPLRSQS